jgi:phospho-N-acetylmuramoyl-pentapeptide-transferase
LLPTVRGGGVAIVLVITGAGVWLAMGSEPAVLGRMVALLTALVTLSFVSFVDDLRGLPARLRFAVHLGAAVTALVVVGWVPSDYIAVAFALLCLLWIGGYTNAFNFMDGINGIAGMQAFFTGLGSAMIAVRLGLSASSDVVILAYAIAGTALGFMPHNFPRAKVFMGDVSSAPLGFLLATIAYWIAQQTAWWVLFWLGLLHANFVLDTGITLVRRIRRGDNLSQAHREHFYQRLIRSGSSHSFVTIAEATLQFVAVVILTTAVDSPVSVRLVGAGLVVAMWIAFFVFAEKRFKAHQAAASTRRA